MSVSKIYRQLLIAALVLAPLLAGRAETASDPFSVYFIGNSLSRGISPERFERLFEEATGRTLLVGTQLSGGCRLYWHLAKSRDKGAPLSTNNLENHPFGDYDHALQNHTIDALILQPYLTWLDTDRESGSPLHLGDRQSIFRFIEYANGRNPRRHRTHSAFYIYATWPRLEGIRDRPGIDANGDGMNSFREFWEAPYLPPEDADSNPRLHLPNRDFFQQLLSGVNADHPELATPVRLIPAGHILAVIDERIRLDRLPGIEAYCRRNADYFAPTRRSKEDFPFSAPFSRRHGVINLYADNVHLSVSPYNSEIDGTLGSYITALACYSVLTGQSPVGLGVGAFARLDAQQDAALIRETQEIVWQVVQAESL